jgi:hypothetical protein
MDDSVCGLVCRYERMDDSVCGLVCRYEWMDGLVIRHGCMEDSV